MLARPRLPFDIDDAKLSPPRIRSTPVKKTEAIATLVSSVSPCVTVSAPAVYGKATPLGRSAEGRSATVRVSLAGRMR